MNRLTRCLVLAAGLQVSALAGGTEPYIGEIIYVAFDFCPSGYAETSGGLLPLSQNTALFSLLGVNFGGNGKSNFALPNLEDRFAVHPGDVPWGQALTLGQSDGSSTLVLSESQIPAHRHVLHTPSTKSQSITETWSISADVQLPGAIEVAEEALARGNRPAATANARYRTGDTNAVDSLTAVRASLSSTTVQTESVGGSQPVNLMPPYVALKACIAIQGIYPQRP
jgi:microcystin-dependent protein